MNPADQIIETLDLKPHPGGGWYRQTWAAENQGRACGTCIYYLLKADERSHWHRIDATEIWHFYAGAPAVVSTAPTSDGPKRDTILGPVVANGETPQLIIAPNHWQATRSTGDYTLFGCTVSPGFQFDGFELAEPDFDIS